MSTHRNFVLIVGAGVAGLMAALECWRKGHDVRIIERSPGRVTSGDSFTIRPTAISSFHNWPEMEEENERISYHPLLAFHAINGDFIKGPMDFFSPLDANAKKSMSNDEHGSDQHEEAYTYPSRMYRHSRPKFHAMLAGQVEKIGLQVEYDKRVVQYVDDEKSPTAHVLLESGETLDADVILAADGIASKSTGITMGHEIRARPTGSTLYRTAFPVDLVLSDPEICAKFPLSEDGRAVFQLWSGDDCHAFFGRTDEEFTWFITRKDDGKAKESWSTNVDPKEAVKFTATINGWPEIADRVIKLTPKSRLMDFRLMWRDPQPVIVSSAGRVVQLGDAAHTFLPSSGNGATQGIEDAITVATCLQLGGKANIKWATKVHNKLRFERVSCFQIFGILNYQSYEGAAIKKAGDEKPKAIRALTGGWVWKHNPEQYAINRFDEAMDSAKNGTPFQNTNIPKGFSYKPWTLDDMMKRREEVEEIDLGVNWES